MPSPAPFPLGARLALVASILKAFIGSGVLFLPKAFSNGGWLFSTLAFCALAALTNVCISKLIAARAALPGGTTYSDMGRRVAGAWGGRAVDLALVLSQGGFCCVYISFIARNALQLANARACALGAGTLWAFVLAELPLLAPLTWVRRIASFGPTNAAGNALILGGLAAILAWCAAGMARAPPAGGGLGALALVGDAAHWPITLGTAVYAFEGAGMVVPLANALPAAHRHRFGAHVSATLAGVTLLYVVIGLVPYAYIEGWTAAKVADAVTLNLPRGELWAQAVVGAYMLALLFSYPYMLFPAIRILEDAALPLLFPAAARAEAGARAALAAAALARAGGAESDGASFSREGGEEWEGEAGEGEGEGAGDGDGAGAGAGAGAPADGADAALLGAADFAVSGRADAGAKWRKNAFRAGVVAATLLVAYVGAPQLDNFVSLIGAFCCTPIAFIFPAWFHAVLVAGPKGARVEAAVDWAIVGVGVGIGVFSTYVAVAGWSTASFDACV